MIYTAGITSCTENRYVTEHGLHSEIGLPLGKLEATISLTNRVTSTRLGKSPAESSTGQMGSRERVDPTQSPFFVGEKERSRIGTRMETFADPQSVRRARMRTKRVQDAGEGYPGSGKGRPCGLCAFLASGAQVKPLPSRALTLPTLFRNRVPETGRAAG